MNVFARSLFCAACLGTLVAAAPVDDDSRVLHPAKSASAERPAAGGWGSYSLVAGLGALAVGCWLVWRGRRGRSGSGDPMTLQISETRSLGNRQYLVVAAFEGRRFLLGVCPGRISLLAPLPGEDLRP